MVGPVARADAEDERPGKQREKSQAERYPVGTERLMLERRVSEIDRLKR